MLARHGRCILLGSHLGSFDVPLFLNESHGDEISVLMHHNQSSRLRGIAGISDDRFDVIQAGLPGSMLLAFDRLQKGGVLGVLGDRSNGSSDVLVSFLGRPISVTRAPYVLSYKAKSPIFLFFALYVGKGRYNVLFRQLTDGPDFDLSQDDFVSMLSQRYVNELACLARDYPENWFNFYNYFDSPSKHKNA
jgi:predicted LPLAT superfamily acyltransferase